MSAEDTGKKERASLRKRLKAANSSLDMVAAEREDATLQTQTAKDVENNILVLEIVNARNVPRADRFSESDPYCVAWIEGKNQSPKSAKQRTIHRDDKKNPDFYAPISFYVESGIEDTDVLVVEIFDYDNPHKSDFLGAARIPVKELKDEDTDFPVGLKDKYLKKKKSLCTVCVRRYHQLPTLVIEVVSANSVPKADVVGWSDPFVTLQLKAENGQYKSEKVSTQQRLDSKDPVWHEYRKLIAFPRPTDQLEVVLHDDDPVGSEKLGKALVPMSELLNNANKEVTVTIKLSKRQGKIEKLRQNDDSTTVTLRYLNLPLPTRRTVFFIRHGESQWNEATEKGKVSQIMQHDHPLNRLGIDQAKSFRALWQQAQAELNNDTSTNVSSSANTEKTKTSPRKRLSVITIQRRSKSSKNEVTIAVAIPDVPSLCSLGAGVTRIPVSISDASAVADVAAKVIEQLAKEVDPSKLDDLHAACAECSLFDAEGNLLDAEEKTIYATMKAKKKEERKLAFMPKGFQSVMEESDRERVKQFLRASTCFSSPLTRATETALVGLHNHPTMKQRGLVLLASAREVKTVVGLDTIGVAYADGHPKRVHEKIAEVVGNDEAHSITNIKIDLHGCMDKWWTPDMDTSHKLSKRFDIFLNTLRWYPAVHQSDLGDVVIVTGHSLFIKEFCATYAQPGLGVRKPSIAPALGHAKLCNAGCIAVDIAWDPISDTPRIVDADLMFGTTYMH